MEKKDLQLRRSNLPYPYKPKTMLFYLFIALAGIFLIAYLHKDSVLQILSLITLGAVIVLPSIKWKFQMVEICLKEEKPLSFKNLRATAASKKGAKYLLIVFGVYLIMVVLGLIFPEKMSSLAVRESYLKMLQEIGNIAAPYMTPPSPSPLIYKLATCTDVIAGTMYYFLGGIIGGSVPTYLWARKLPK